MRNRLLLSSFLLGHCFFANAQQNHWKQQVKYSIAVQLRDKDHTLDGFLRLQYTNNSPDTLAFLWFQLWPNAFKNDRTAFSEHLLDTGRNDFYFSANSQRGYINRLEFRSGNDLLKEEEDARYIDLAKVYLQKPLPPGESVNITTPFHVKLPYDFAGVGHTGHAYRMAQWYPAIAAYDTAGWHEVPYTGQRASAAEPGDIAITISLPKQYEVKTEGTLVEETASDSIRVLQYVWQHTNDFSWTASLPGYTPEISRKKNGMDARIHTFIQKALKKSWLPAIGYNRYDGVQLGALAQNLMDSEARFTYFVASLYATRSGRINGLGLINYSWQPSRFFSRADAGLNVSAFSTSDGVDSNGKKIFAGFYKLAPYIRVTLPAASRHTETTVEWKTYILGEQSFQYVLSGADSIYYPSAGKTNARYLNQLSFRRISDRSLYPYEVQLQAQQANSFYRLNGELHYFFNYAGGGGMQLRVFAAKFGYLGAATSSKKFETLRYQPKLTAVSGSEDYTYSDYFAGRSEFNGFASQQMMMRDGGLKIRTDMFQDLQGRSDNWVASMNLNTTLPAKILPAAFPLRIFLDAGTYAEAWKRESALPRFLYVAGLQLSVLKNIVNIYAPLLYSKEFRDNLKTVPEQNTFLKRLSFSIDIHRLDLIRISRLNRMKK